MSISIKNEDIDKVWVGNGWVYKEDHKYYFEYLHKDRKIKELTASQYTGVLELNLDSLITQILISKDVIAGQEGKTEESSKDWLCRMMDKYIKLNAY